MFCMAAYADGPYWKSCLEVMCCPSGYSFYRPFSFRREYLSQDLQNMIAEPNQVKKNIRLPSWNVGFVGMRFRSANFRNKFVPLRKVTITSILEQDKVQVFFRLGDYVCHVQESLVLELDDIIDLSKPEITLFFSVPVDNVPTLQDISLSKQMPSKLWECLMSPGEISPEAQENFLNTLVLRFCGYRLHGTSNTLPPKKIESGGERGDVFGSKLVQWKCYDFALHYSRIMRAGEASSDIPACQYEWIPQGDKLKVAQSVIPVTGNYRMESIWADVQKSSPAPIELRFIPISRGTEQTETSSSEIKSFELRVLALTVTNLWAWRRIVILLVILATLVATIACGLMAVYKPNHATLYLAFLAASAGICGSLLKDVLMGRTK